MQIRVLFAVIALLVLGASELSAAGVRVQLEEVLFKIDAAGNSHPIDHQVIDVFPLTFDEQFGAVDKVSPNGKYGASYIEVPASASVPLNHNVYAYVADGPFVAITDGYHNGQVPGAQFKITVMTTRRLEDTVRVRTMHIIDAHGAGGPIVSGAALRHLQAKVDAMLASSRHR